MKLSFFSKMAFIVFLFSSSSIRIVFAQSSKTFDVKKFSAVTVSNGINIYLKQGNTESVVAKGDEDILHKLDIAQNGNTIKIAYKKNTVVYKKDAKVYITLKNFTALVSSGGSEVETEGNINANTVAITISGGSEVDLKLKCSDIKLTSSGDSEADLKLNCQNLALTASGGSDVSMKGSCQNIHIVASSGSDVNAYNFIAQTAKIVASGASEIKINVSKNLNIVASGASNVRYKGAAVLKSATTSKSSEIKHVN